MSDYLTNLAARTLNPEQAIKPRLTALYEPLRVTEVPISASQYAWEPPEVIDRSDKITFADAPRITQPSLQSTLQPTSSSETAPPAQPAATEISEPVDDSPPFSELTQTQPSRTSQTQPAIRRSPTVMSEHLSEDTLGKPAADSLQLSELPEAQPVLTSPPRTSVRRSPQTAMPTPLSQETPDGSSDDSPEISELSHAQPVHASSVGSSIRRPPASDSWAPLRTENTSELADDPLQMSGTHNEQPIVSPPFRAQLQPPGETKVRHENLRAEIPTESEQAQHESCVVLPAYKISGQPLVTREEHRLSHERETRTDAETQTFIDTTVSHKTVATTVQTGALRQARAEQLVRQSRKEAAPRVEPERPTLPIEPERPPVLFQPKVDQVKQPVESGQRNAREQPLTAAISSPRKPTSATSEAFRATPAVIVRPHSVTQASPTKTEIATTPPESSATEPTVQVTIGRIEIRASSEAEPRRDAQRPAASKLMSLDDYLRQRAQGVGR